MKTIVTINFKGGVGKTTCTWALGYVAAHPSKKPCSWLPVVSESAANLCDRISIADLQQTERRGALF